MSLKEPLTIGKRDIADFPSFNLTNIRVKIDSGAYTSTIHCSLIEEKGGELHVIFLDENQEGYTGEVHVFTSFELKKVRSSNGELQERYIINGTILLFNREFETEFTLSQRDLMRYPVLLGRKLLSHHFLIDTSKTDLSFHFKNKSN